MVFMAPDTMGASESHLLSALLQSGLGYFQGITMWEVNTVSSRRSGLDLL